MTKSKTVVSLIINVLITVITTYVVISYFFVESETIKNGVESFKYFTTDSNVLAAIASFAFAVCDIRVLKDRTKTIPRFVEVFKYISVVALVLTFCTVVIFLLPIYGAEILLGGTAFHMHVGAPAMALFSFVFLEKNSPIFFFDTLFALIPEIIYGGIYFVEVVILGEARGGWSDFYSFNQGGKWTMTVLIMFASVYVIAVFVSQLHNIGTRKKKYWL